MPRYKYSATGLDGKKVKGAMEAPDENELYTRLRSDGKYLLESKLEVKASNTSKMKAARLSEFSRQLGTLLGAGVSLIRALNIVAQDENVKPKEKAIYDNMMLLIRQGIPLSEAMAQQGSAFPPLMVNMFKAAESSGGLDKTSMRMAEHYQKEHRLNAKVKSAMTYPIILLCITVLVVIAIFVFILPQFSTILDDTENLPGITKFILSITGAFQNYAVWIIVGVVIIVVAFYLILRLPKVKLFTGRIKLRLPVVGNLLKTIYTARFSRTLSSLYAAGLPIVTALSIASSTIGNSYIESQFNAAVSAVKAGETLSSAIGNIDGFVKKLASSVLIGEETGSLDSMLDSTSDALDYDSEMAITQLTTMLEPIMIIIMALIVGTIMIAVMLPIFNSYGAMESAAGVY